MIPFSTLFQADVSRGETDTRLQGNVCVCDAGCEMNMEMYTACSLFTLKNILHLFSMESKVFLEWPDYMPVRIYNLETLDFTWRNSPRFTNSVFYANLTLKP